MSRNDGELGVVVHAFMPSTQEEEARGLLGEFQAKLVYIQRA